MERSLLLRADATGISIVSGGQGHHFEVLGIPADYTDSEALAIVEAVRAAGVLPAPPGRGKAIRITWKAIVEKGIASGVLAEQDQ